MSNTVMRDRYWAMYIQAQADFEYFYNYACFYRRITNCIDAILGVMGSASVVTLTIWNSIETLKITLLALTSILASLNLYLPFKRYDRVATDISLKIEPILLNIKNDYYHVENKTLKDDEMNQKIYEYENQIQTVTSTEKRNAILPYSNRARKKADKIAQQRIEQIFCIRGDSNGEQKHKPRA